MHPPRRVLRWAWALAALFALTPRLAPAQIYQFVGGVRIPAGLCATYPDAPQTQVTTSLGNLHVSNPSGPVRLRAVCPVPVPEKALIRQFVMVGKVTAGEIFATLSARIWNQPASAPFYANLTMNPTSFYEIPNQQMKAVFNLPATGSGSLRTDRIQAYYIEATFTSPSAVAASQALTLDYFEIYWNN